MIVRTLPTAACLLMSLSAAGFPPPPPGEPATDPDTGERHPPALPRPTGVNATGWRLEAHRISQGADAWLRTQQDPATGGWSINPEGPNFPAISALALTGMIELAERQGWQDVMKDPAIAAGVKFLLSRQQPDGGIYDTILPSYNTAISIVALAKVNTPEARSAVARATDYLKALQYGEGAVVFENAPESAQRVGKDHPFYGGWGYGNRGRPDLSNTAFAIEALRAAGVPESDPVYQRALVFLSRVQMDERVNDMAYAKGSRQGGFIYATAENKDTVGAGQSFAGTIEETLSDGTTASRLRSYGSMTYSGFKSLIYAGLTRDDPRVVTAHGWLRDNYTTAENPGMGTDGLYYYFLAMSRALDAWGRDFIDGPEIDPSLRANPDREDRPARRWGEDLTTRLGGLQQQDGSFKSVDDRWMENNPVLITAYALVTLQHASRPRPE